jgi:hypothetical protein
MKRQAVGCKHLFALLICATAAAPGIAQAQGRLLATGGVTQVEGAAGGGLVPWALIAGYGTRDEIGGTGFGTYIDSGDFRLRSAGGAIGFYDRVEASVARQRFDLGSTVPGKSITQDVLGLKVKVAGDAIYDQDTWLPQIAVGLQYKHNRDFDSVPKALGAKRDSDFDYYVAATKVFLAGLAGRNVVLNALVRATRANQLGLLGFGGDKNDSYRAQFEGSAGIFLTDQLLVGAEYRSKPDNLSVFREQDFSDAFVAYVPNKHVALTAAYAWLGNVADKPNQRAWYLSLQLSF